jgi:hypothetical protein
MLKTSLVISATGEGSELQIPRVVSISPSPGPIPAVTKARWASEARATPAVRRSRALAGNVGPW